MKVTLMEVRDYFNMSSKEMAESWKVLNDEEREFFKREVGTVLYPE